ncbi:hypothetical protein [Nonomuraea salmonea]|uniref:hypothetical protein n=1 Tax=Nonomuraea salmonea TaxID=46181 RepID=UPI002FEA0973
MWRGRCGGFGLAGAVAAAAAVAIVVSGNTAVPGPGVRHPVATEQTPTEQTPTEQAPHGAAVGA